MNENDFKKAIEQIPVAPDLKQKVLTAVQTPCHSRIPRPLPKAAMCFAAILVLMLGVFWRPNPTAPDSNNQFTLVAMAADQKQNTMKKGSTIRLQTYSADGFSFNTLNLKDGSEEWYTYNVFGLKCQGENIKNITYESDRLTFAKIVILTKKQVHDYYEMFQAIEDTKGDYYPSDYPIDPWSFDMTGVGVDLTNFFDVSKYTQEDPTEVHWAYKTVGKSYTIAYEDQDDLGKQYGYRLSYLVSAEQLAKEDEIIEKLRPEKEPEYEILGPKVRRRKPSAEWDKFDQAVSEFENKKISGMISPLNGTKLRITVTFQDGSTQTRNVVLHTDPDGFDLTATLLD
ncbi:hypothetical protein [Clostridium minihomine]|uniref:hypothetical protein n=1 Tax=Clostridium minihomine TaxID=2045012 RepID=UPI000C78D74E|nr:hypothetical protein [Clostridium minihomine]